MSEEATFSRKGQIEQAIVHVQGQYGVATENTNRQRSLVEAHKELNNLHIEEVEREKAEAAQAEADALELKKVSAKEIAATIYLHAGYNSQDGAVTSQKGTVQSEDHIYRNVTFAMGRPHTAKDGSKLSLSQTRYKMMPQTIHGKRYLSIVYEPRPDDQSSNAYSYPDIGGFIFVLRNKTDEEKTVDIPTVMSSYSSNYSAAVISTLTPNANNNDPSLITAVTFENLLYYTSSQSDRSYTQQAIIPARTSKLFMIQAAARYYTDVGEAYAMNFFCNVSLEEALSVDGIVIDIGAQNNIDSGMLEEPYQIFKTYDGITNWTDGT